MWIIYFLYIAHWRSPYPKITLNLLDKTCNHFYNENKFFGQVEINEKKKNADKEKVVKNADHEDRLGGISNIKIPF